jgi:type IV pilus assembly protein PilN
MAKINLLPWREEQRRQQAKQFGLTALATGLIAAGVVFTGSQIASSKIDYQQSRNNYMQREINKLKAELKEIEELESTKANLLARMDIIQELQTKRPQVVHTFQELAERVPDGVYLLSMKQDGDRLSLEGRADSNARVSTLMRNLDASDWFKQPGLEVIQSAKNSGISTFKLGLSQSVAPADDNQLAVSDE